VRQVRTVCNAFHALFFLLKKIYKNMESVTPFIFKSAAKQIFFNGVRILGPPL
jgi:hypothetical protein